MDRNSGRRDDRRDDRRPRDDTRNHKARYEQTRDRSRSPRRSDRRDDRRRSPPPPPPNQQQQRGPPPPRSSDPHDFQQRTTVAPPRDRYASRRDSIDSKAHLKKQELHDTKMAVDDQDSSDAEMKRVMGFQQFRSTKETKVPGNDRNYGVYKVKKAEYRQYMNRVGGFNRPLDAMGP